MAGLWVWTMVPVELLMSRCLCVLAAQVRVVDIVGSFVSNGVNHRHGVAVFRMVRYELTVLSDCNLPWIVIGVQK